MKKILITTAIVTLGITSMPAFAATDNDLQAIQAQMLEMMKRIETLEKENKTLRATAPQKAVATNNILEDRVVKLEQENLTLRTKVESNEDAITQTATTTVASVEPAAGGSHKDGMLIPGTETRLKLGGYLKVDAIHDFSLSRDGAGEDFGLYAAIPLDSSTEDQKNGNTRLHARQTRLNLTATTPTEYGDLKMFVEGDFFAEDGSQNTSNAARFGLRQAYGQLGGFLAGQAWSNYMDLAAYPESLDFVGVAGNTLLRQGQIRYTHTPEGSSNSYSVSIENPNSEFISNPANPGADSSIEKYPDVTLKARFKGDFGEASVKGVGRKLEAFSTSTGQSDSDFGYAVAASGKINTFGKDDIRFQAAYGDGIGRYLFDLAVGSQGAGFDSNTNSVEAIEAWGGYVAYRHWWNDTLRSNVMAGTVRVLDNPSSATTANESVTSANANLIWSATPKVDVGAEYIYGHRETEAGAEGTLNRVQMSATYKF